MKKVLMLILIVGFVFACEKDQDILTDADTRPRVAAEFKTVSLNELEKFKADNPDASCSTVSGVECCATGDQGDVVCGYDDRTGNEDYDQ